MSNGGEGRGKVPNLCAISSFSFASFVIFLHCLASKLDASTPLMLLIDSQRAPAKKQRTLARLI